LCCLLFFSEEDNAQWKEFVQEQQQKLGLSIKFLKEETVLGTGGGLLNFEKEIMQGNPSHIFVLHCDILSTFPLQEILSVHMSHANASCTILGKRVASDQAHKYGCLVVDPKTHELMHYAEKPETFISDMINTGVYVFSPTIFDHLRKGITLKMCGHEKKKKGGMRL
jgi:mannose-1-phosphate guanylyltransferase